MQSDDTRFRFKLKKKKRAFIGTFFKTVHQPGLLCFSSLFPSFLFSGAAGFILCIGEVSQRQHLGVCVPAQGHEPTAAAAAAAVAAEGAHLEGNAGVSVGDVAAAGQQLQGGVTELVWSANTRREELKAGVERPGRCGVPTCLLVRK